MIEQQGLDLLSNHQQLRKLDKYKMHGWLQILNNRQYRIRIPGDEGNKGGEPCDWRCFCDTLGEGILEQSMMVLLS